MRTHPQMRKHEGIQSWHPGETKQVMNHWMQGCLTSTGWMVRLNVEVKRHFDECLILCAGLKEKCGEYFSTTLQIMQSQHQQRRNSAEADSRKQTNDNRRERE
jgi:hypothetical protein